MNAQKLPQVNERLIKDSFQAERPQIDLWLRGRGIEGGIQELYNDGNLAPDGVPALLELLELPYSLQTRGIISQAILRRRPNASQKRRAFEVFLAILRQSIGEYNVILSTLVLNQLAGFATPDRVHEAGEIVLDSRYGQIRAEMTFVLRKIGNADAITYLLRAAKDPVTATLALDGLARLRVGNALVLCEEALANPAIPQSQKGAIKRTCSKLKRLGAGKAITPTHVTNEAVPGGLVEWSTNLDGGDLPKVLRGIRRCVEAGFGQTEVAETTSISEALSPDQTARFRFPGKLQGEDSDLWLEVYCNDEDAFDLYVFGSPDLVGRIQKTMEEILK